MPTASLDTVLLPHYSHTPPPTQYTRLSNQPTTRVPPFVFHPATLAKRYCISA
ncbi:hypothetical protein B0T17DRAFT_522484 [Bombardia bombarda]|uniref:Uncharacterized protein n=1 Tax=Bombardia bombarda TaxID=252184 RepID=A0AA39X6R7_9PEZI|nr:hypothetical protein B0T17DRAFT_522484 [Bombardia bombarda]